MSVRPWDQLAAVVTAVGPMPEGVVIGHSREGRPISAYRFGEGPLRINLVGGCHADEPVGPRLLERLIRHLDSPEGQSLRGMARWSVVPHLNPDGADANALWQTPDADAYDPVLFMRSRTRELPGDDIEFGFPRTRADAEARPENMAAQRFWEAEAPFDLHVSMHGMSVARGPYFLVEQGWWARFRPRADELAALVHSAGYHLHDVERLGEKGFHRLAPGFCTRPDSRPMAEHFLELGDPETAARFRPSSMEAVRTLSGDTLTLVTEMPLFLTPGVGDELGPPDPVLMEWRARIADWERRLRSTPAGSTEEADVRAEIEAFGLVPMPVADQWRYQWAFICAGIETVVAEKRRG